MDVRPLRSILTIIVAYLAMVPGVSAATKSAPSLKIGELSTRAIYDALPVFVLGASTPEQKAFVVDQLIRDGSPDAIEALAEIAELSEDKSLAEKAFNAAKTSREALSRIAALSTFTERRAAAREALKTLAPTKREPPRTNLPSANFSFAQKALLEHQGDLTKFLSVGEDLTNGSRFVIQSWFMKKLLSLQTASPKERLLRFDALLNEISLYLSREPKVISIQSKADLDHFKESLGSRFAFLKDEMEFSKGLTDLSPIKLDISPEMRKDVQAFSDSFREFDRKIEFLENTTLFDLLSNRQEPGLLLRLKIKSQSRREKLSQLKLIHDQFDEQYRSLRSVAQQIIDSKAIRFTKPAEQRFFELMVHEYFSNYTFEQTANVMKALLERPDRKDYFRLMVLYAGPQMQKLLQVISRRTGISKELSSTFKELEESGLASPWERIAPQFEKPPVNSTWVSLGQKAFVGSIAEVYKGEVRYRGQNVEIAARTLKCDIQDRVEEEIPRLMNLARVIDNDRILRSYDFPLVSPMMEDVMEMTRAELNVRETILNQKRGERIYQSDQKLKNGQPVHFRVAETLVSEKDNVMFSLWLPGEKFETFAGHDSNLAVELAELTAHHWIENALFGERFFHADLHQGNIKISRSTDGGFNISLLDFGMVGSISALERSIIIRLAIATKRNRNPALVAKYLWALSDAEKNNVTFPQLIEAAAHYMKTAPKEELTLEYWLAWSLSRGLKLPKNITAFSRGIGAIEQLAFSTGSEKELVDLVQDVALRHAVELAPDLVRYLRDSVATVVNQTVQKTMDRVRPLRCEALFTN